MVCRYLRLLNYIFLSTLYENPVHATAWRVMAIYVFIHKEGACLSSENINYHHHQPINVPTAGTQAFLMDYT
jgi:hypothetical protein